MHEQLCELEIETYLKLPWNPIKTLLKHPGNFLETAFWYTCHRCHTSEASLTYTWNFFYSLLWYFLDTALKHSWMKQPCKFLETSLKCSGQTTKTSVKHAWNFFCWPLLKHPELLQRPRNPCSLVALLHWKFGKFWVF